MGFLRLIPATSLKANYFCEPRKLVLHAKGEKEEITYDIHFRLVPAVDVVKFRLEGWIGPITGRKSDYECTDEFCLTLGPHYPKIVIIADAEHPMGQEVGVNYHQNELPKMPQQGSATSGSAGVLTEAGYGDITLNGENITELLGTPFRICQGLISGSDEFSSIRILFDAKFLALVGAGIEEKNMFWKFNPVQLGKTQVVVERFGGIAAPSVSRKSYVVTIVRRGHL